MPIDVRRAHERFATRLSWLDSRHSFSFGQHYDPRNTHHGLLLVHNEDVVQPGNGFATHSHRNTEIVTLVLGGSLVHRDSTGRSGVIHPGLAQRVSAGTGVLHSETNESGQPLHLVQMWLMPDDADMEPSYEQANIEDRLRDGDLVPVASGMTRYADVAAIRLGSRRAALHAARPTSATTVTLPDAPFVHLFVAAGAVRLEGAGRPARGDAARLTGTGGQQVVADEGSEILVWEMHASVTRL